MVAGRTNMMFRFKIVGASLLLAVGAGLPMSGAILYQSALNGGTNGGAGDAIFNSQFLGSRFTLNFPANITNIIGEVGSQGGTQTLFMTLLQLSGPGALPSNVTGSPFANATQLYTTTFSSGAPGDISFPVSLLVQPGTYAIVFGSGLFGSPAASGYMPNCCITVNPVLPGADLIAWYSHTGNPDFATATWSPITNQGERFVVQGNLITPEPGSMLMIGVGITAMVLLRRRVSRLTF